jgi:hypothetical protein
MVMIMEDYHYLFLFGMVLEYTCGGIIIPELEEEGGLTSARPPTPIQRG